MKVSFSHIIIFALVILFGILSFSRCAKVVSPSGGPKDSIPPQPIRAEPPNYSTGFSTDEIEIEFNEFITFKEMNKQFISSPPFSEKPDISERGKKVKVFLNDTLKDSTTYTLNFGNAIVDFREGNALRNFRYVFSTGSIIDSLYVEGQVFDAYSLKPKKNVAVMLYERFKDSLPYTRVPDFVARTDEEGKFLIPNLREDQYKIFALEDENNNYLYDSPDENIGFSDTTIKFTKEEFTDRDTIYKDTIERENNSDSLVIDTVEVNEYREWVAKDFQLRLFNEDQDKQYLKTSNRKEPQKISFIFNRPVEDSISLNLLDTVAVDSADSESNGLDSIKTEKKLLAEKNMEDTLTYWILDSTIYNQEYLTFELSYPALDSAGEKYERLDTLELRYSFEQEQKDTIELATNASKSGLFDLNRKIHISHPYPLESIDTSGICLWKVQDTVMIEKDVKLEKDTGNLYGFRLLNDLQQNSSYKLQIITNTVKSIYEFYHDTLEVDFQTQEKDHYGELTMDMGTIDKPFIFQLLKSEEDLYREEWYPASYNEKIKWDYLEPGEYSIRLIIDENGNKEWDTGDYLNHIQPEKVSFYPEKIEIRSNWELELKWDVNINSIVKPKKEK
ncbi:MAG: Ig-like domain-containing protein [Bacteroidota bacterium]